MRRNLSNRRERLLGSLEGNAVMVEHLYHAGNVGADDAFVLEHQRLMAVANLVGEPRPVGRRPGTNHEHRFPTFDDADDEPQRLEDQAIALAKDAGARERRGEFDASIGDAPGASSSRSSHPSVMVSRPKLAAAVGRASGP